MLKILFNVKEFFLKLLRVILSPLENDNSCVVCGRKTLTIPVCFRCREKYFSVPDMKNGFCKVCGKMLVSEKELCMECKSGDVLKNLDAVYPLFSYRLWNVNLLCRWKLKGERVLSDFFASLVKVRLEMLYFEKGDFAIVPVPPRPGKIKKEGWDQIQELSIFLKLKYGFEILDILERKNCVQQKTLNRKERLLTIGASYFVKEEVREVPERVCILDDVMTTGSTLEGISSLLKSKGAQEVFAVTLFTVDG